MLKRLDWTLEELDRQNNLELLRARQQHTLAYVAHGRLDEDSFDAVRDAANENISEYRQLLYPWRK